MGFMALASFCRSKALAWSLLTLPLSLACTITTGPAQSPAPGTAAAPPPPPPPPPAAQPQAGSDDKWEGEAEATGKPPAQPASPRTHAHPTTGAAAPAPVHEDPAPTVNQRTGDPNAPTRKQVGQGTTANPASEETRTNDAIAAVVRANRQPFRDCYDRAAAKDPNLVAGTLTLHFVIDPTGRVKLAELNDPRSTIKAPAVVNCTIAVLKQLKFPASSRGMESAANYPFDFKR